MTARSRKRRGCFVSVGEHSGDMLAAELLIHLRSRVPTLDIFGMTGPRLDNIGIESIASMDRFGVMGFVDVLKKLPELLETEKLILEEIDRRKPEAAILVDFPGFHFRLAEQLKRRGIKVVQFVAPKVWAWGVSRVRRLREDFDLVLGIFPFETEFFAKHDVNFQYIGTPQLDRTSKIELGRSSLGLADDLTVFSCLPGSRLTEVERILPTIYAVANAISKRVDGARFIVPVAENLDIDGVISLAEEIGGVRRAWVEASNLPAVVVGPVWFVPGMSLEMMAISDATLVASGTATLECALLGTPMSVVYRMDETSYEIARKKVQINHFSLANILAGKEIVREFIQHYSTDEIADDLIKLASGGCAAQDMKREFERIKGTLSGAACMKAAEYLENSVFALPERSASSRALSGRR